MRWPELTLLGWLCVIGAFLLTMYAIIYSIVAIFHIDMAQYTPGPNGESPATGSAGMVKEAMFALAYAPTHVWRDVPVIKLGAPRAEECNLRHCLF